MIGLIRPLVTVHHQWFRSSPPALQPRQYLTCRLWHYVLYSFCQRLRQMNQGLDGNLGLLLTPSERLLDKAVAFGYPKPICLN